MPWDYVNFKWIAPWLKQYILHPLPLKLNMKSWMKYVFLNIFTDKSISGHEHNFVYSLGTLYP